MHVLRAKTRVSKSLRRLEKVAATPFPALSLPPLFALALQPGVTHSELTVVMETERRAGSWVTGFLLDFFKLAICSFTLWDQRPKREAPPLHVQASGGIISAISRLVDPHLYLVLWPRPQETLQAAQLDQELHTQEAWQL